MIELNHIYNEDCLVGMQGIADKSVDAIICDLPYGTTEARWDSIIPFEPLWAQYKRVIKDNGVICLFGQQPFTSKLILSNMEMFRHMVYWQKDKCANFQSSGYMPLKYIEEIVVYSKRGFAHNSRNKCTYNAQRVPRPFRRAGKVDLTPTMTMKTLKPRPNLKPPRCGDGFDPTSKAPSNIIYFTTDHWDVIHPTQKPVALIEYLIKTYSNEGDTILDNCMGSGTTAIACINTNRNFIGFEKDKEYYDKSIQRINEHRKQLTLAI